MVLEVHFNRNVLNKRFLKENKIKCYHQLILISDGIVKIGVWKKFPPPVVEDYLIFMKICDKIYFKEIIYLKSELMNVVL